MPGQKQATKKLHPYVDRGEAICQLHGSTLLAENPPLIGQGVNAPDAAGFARAQEAVPTEPCNGGLSARGQPLCGNVGSRLLFQRVHRINIANISFESPLVNKKALEKTHGFLTDKRVEFAVYPIIFLTGAWLGFKI